MGKVYGEAITSGQNTEKRILGSAEMDSGYLQETLNNASKVLESMKGVEDAEKGRSAAAKALGELRKYKSIVTAQRDKYANADELLKEIDNSILAYDKYYNGLSPESIKLQNQIAAFKKDTYSVDDVLSGEISGGEALNLLGKEKKLGTGIDFDVADRKSTENKNIIFSAMLAKDKQKRGQALTEAEKQAIADADELTARRNAITTNLFTLSKDRAHNGQNLETAKGISLYSSAKNQEYLPGEKIEPAHTGNARLDLYLNTGFNQYFEGQMQTFNMIVGKGGVEETRANPVSGYDIASQKLGEYFNKTGQSPKKAIQDIVTNVASNAIPIMLGFAVGGLAGEAAAGSGATAAQVSKISNIAGRVASGVNFASSTFGNAYTEAVRTNATDDYVKLLAYAAANTALEVGLEMAIGGMPVVGGALSGNAITALSKNVKRILPKIAVIAIGNGTGEFVEEGLQGIFGPLLQRYILGADVDTIFTDTKGQLKSALYQGFIGFASSLLMGGTGHVQEALSQKQLSENGKYYSALHKEMGIDLKDTVEYIKNMSDNKELIKKADKLLEDLSSGKASDYDIGEVFSLAFAQQKEGENFLYTKIGESIKAQDYIEAYEECAKSGIEFEAETENNYKLIKAGLENGEQDNKLIGQFAVDFTAKLPEKLVGKITNAIIENEMQKGDSTKEASNTGSAFNEVSVAKKESNFYDDALAYIDGEENLTKEQAFVKGIAKSLDIPLEFGRVYLPDGKTRTDGITFKDGRIVIDYECKQPLKFLFKHESSHFGQRSKFYAAYRDAVLESKAFAEWVANTEIFGEKMQGETAEEKIKNYKAKIRQAYKKAYKGLSQVEQELKSEYEMMANFAGETLFSGDMTALTKMLGGMEAKQRNAVIDFIADLFRYLKEKLSGNKQITLEIVKLERMFNEAVYDAAQSFKSESQTSQNEKNTTEKIFGSGEYSIGKSFSQQVNDVINGTHNRRLDLYVSETPKILVDLGFSDTPLLMRNGKINEMLEKHPEISEVIIKQIPEKIKKPILVLKSKTHPSESVVVITDVITEKGNMIIPVWVNQEGNYIDFEIGEEVVENTNFVATAYGRNVKALLEYANENEGFLYQSENTEKVRELLARNGLQLPTPLKLSDSDIIVPSKKQSVNNNLSDEGGDYSINVNKTRDDALDLLDGKITLDEYVEKQEKINKARESRIRRKVKAERAKFKGFSGSIIDLEQGVKTVLGISDSTYDKEMLKTELGALLSLADRKNINQDTVSTLRAACEQMAEQIVEQSEGWHIRSEDSQELLDQIRGRKIYLSDHQKSEIEFIYGSVREYQNKLRGRVVFTNDRNLGAGLEDVFRDMAKVRGDLFGEQVFETNLPKRFEENIETLVNDYVEYDPKNAIRNTTDALLTMCMNVRRENLKAYTKAQLKSTGELIRTEEQARLEAADDRRRKLNNIQRVTNKLARRLVNGTDASHIPDNLGKAITDFLNVFNENSSVVFDKKILQFLTGELNAFKRVRERDFESTDFYDEDVIASIAELEDILTNDIIQNLDNETLGVIEDICNYFDFLVNDQEEQFLNGKKRKAKEVGNGALRDLEQEHSRLTKASEYDFVTNSRGFIVTNNLPPYYVFKRLGPTFENLYNDMVEGSDRCTKHLDTAANFFEELYKKYNYKKWKKDTVKFQTKYGVEMEITVEQALQLWATGNRERSINPKQTKHIFSGGVSFDLETIKKAKGFANHIKGKKANKVEKLREELRTGSRTTALRIGFEEIDTIEALLSEEQLGYAREIVNFLSTECGNWGNEVSLQMYGYKKYTEKTYIPYITLESFLKTEGGIQAQQQTVRKPGFTHTLQRFAKTPLLIEGLSTTAAAHIEKMAGYNALAVPLNTFNSILNYTEQKIRAKFNGEEEIIPIRYDSTYDETLKKHFNKTERELKDEGYELDIIAGKSVKETLEQSFGKDAREYIDKFFEDLNGGIRRDGSENLIAKAAGNVKKAAVLMSMSVVVQQPTAIIRASKYIDSKYFAKAAKYHASWDEVKFNAPVAALKEKGRYNVGMGVSNRNWILGSEGESFGDKVDNVTGWAAGKADCATWHLLYKAVMAEIADTTELEVGSIEFNEAVGKRFTEIIYKTQVFDSTLTKSANLRSNSLTMKNITSFMAEPTLSMAMLYDGALDLAEKKISVKDFGRTVASVMLSGVFAAAFKSFVAAARDDDEDRTYWERYIEKLSANLLDEITLLNKIPWFRDIVTLKSGYNVERYDLTAVADIVNAYKKLLKDLESDEFSRDTVYELSASVATFFGIPLKNLNRDIEAIFNVADDIKEAAGEGREFSWNEARFAWNKGRGQKDGVDANYERLAEALLDGDQKKYDSVYEHLETKGKTESEIHSGIVKALKKDGDVKKEFKNITDGIKDNKTYQMLSDEHKEKAENEILTALAKEAKAEAEEARSAVYDRMYEYKRLGKKKALQEEKDKLIKQGVSEYEIENGIEVAKYAYLKSIGIDLKAYALFMMAKKEDYADLDGSGGVSKAEKIKAADNVDTDSKTKNAIKKAINQGIF